MPDHKPPETLITAEQIQVRIQEMAADIRRDFPDGVHMIAVLKALLTENRKRAARDRIVFRPDHGHRMLDDLAETKRTNPGYTAIGRLRGLAELRGAIRAIEHTG